MDLSKCYYNNINNVSLSYFKFAVDVVALSLVAKF